MVTLQTTNFEEENFKTFIDGNDNNLYELNILNEIHYINIKCHIQLMIESKFILIN